MDLLYFVLLCSVLIFVHELGHFVWAKIFGVKVLTFSIGLGPKIVRLRGRETEYCIGILPFGGFVKMLEVGREEPVLPEDGKRTFEAQALWKRVVIVLAGPAMNVLFPVLLYFSVFVGDTRSSPPVVGTVLPGHAAEGKLEVGDRVLEIDGKRISTFSELRRRVEKSPGKELKLKLFRDSDHVELTIVPTEVRIERPLGIVDSVGEIGVAPSRPASVVGIARTDSPAYRAGLRTFDLVTEVRGRPTRTFAELEDALAQNRGETVPVAYLRPVPVKALGGLGEFWVYESGVAALTPEQAAGDLLTRTGLEHAGLYLADVPPGSPEARAGLRPGDRIVEVDGIPVLAWSSFSERLLAAPSRPHALTFSRGGEMHAATIQLERRDEVDEFGARSSAYGLRATPFAPVVHEAPVQSEAPVAFALEAAVDQTIEVVRFICVGIVRLLQGEMSLSTLGGPITVYDMVGQEGQRGAAYFVFAMAVISINLGLINLLPIPVLDGGQLLFLLCEAVLRRPLPLRVREAASLVGLATLVALMGVALKNDVERRWDVLEGQVEELLD